MTACPLDCYDACQVIDVGERLKGGANSYTKGYLCPHLNHYFEDTQLTKAFSDKREVSLDAALELLIERLKKSEPEKILFYRGSGNVGRIQAVSDLFYGRLGAALTEGSLCDAAGQEGIIAGRGYNEVVSPEQIAQSDVVVLWGRNPSNTNTHLLQLLEGKKLVVIDPIETELAKKSDLFIQIKPRGDFYLALLLCRFALMEEMEDKAFIEEYTDNFTWFHDFIRSIAMKKGMEKSAILPSQAYAFLELIKGNRVVFLVGAGVQKYRHGADVLRAIDSFAVLLGLMGKEGCGVSFLGDSGRGIADPFALKAKREKKATADFSKYDLVVFQGSNALESMPDSQRVIKALEGKYVVYMGLHENLTSQRADLVIPAKNFLAKEDLRLSYMDHTAKRMQRQRDTDYGISEYELTRRLGEAFGHEPLKSEEAYIDEMLSSCTYLKDNLYRIDARSEIAYSEGFETDEDAFLFIEETDDKFLLEEESLFLITPKSKKGLNTMFKRPEGVYLHPALGFAEGERVRVFSSYGEVLLSVCTDATQRRDTVCIYSGTKGVNNITPSLNSDCGNNAVFQEISVKVEKC